MTSQQVVTVDTDFRKLVFLGWWRAQWLRDFLSHCLLLDLSSLLTTIALRWLRAYGAPEVLISEKAPYGRMSCKCIILMTNRLFCMACNTRINYRIERRIIRLLCS